MDYKLNFQILKYEITVRKSYTEVAWSLTCLSQL